MRKAVGTFCACLLLTGAGCWWNIGNTRIEADVRINDQAVDVALDEAVARVQRELQKRGLEVAVSPDADAARVVCKTKRGDQFTIVLSRVRTASGKEQTRVRVEWGTSKPDRELWFELLLALGVSAIQ
jgi:hypothetical protein